MKRCIAWWGIVSFVTAALIASQVVSQEKPAKPDKKQAKKEKPEAKEVPPAINMEEMMKKWMEVATPSEGHKALEPLVGNWETVSRFWMAGPQSPPMESKGAAQTVPILGGRFIEQRTSGSFMEMPFEGRGLTGYDNFKKKYISFWIDNMGTAMYTSQGSMDPSGKAITFYGQMDEPTTGEQDKMTKMVLRIISQDQHVVEMYDLSLGDNAKMGEITYTRKNEPASAPQKTNDK